MGSQSVKNHFKQIQATGHEYDTKPKECHFEGNMSLEIATPLICHGAWEITENVVIKKKNTNPNDAK